MTFLEYPAKDKGLKWNYRNKSAEDECGFFKNYINMILTLNLITDSKFTDRLIEDCHLFYLRVFKDNYEVPKRLESLFDLKDKIDDKVVAKVSMSAVNKKPNKVT